MEYIDKIYCINLDSRPDRWQECLDEFKKLNIENEVERVTAFKMPLGIDGCTKSHLECIKLAKQNNFKNVLILEDDVSFEYEIFYDVLYNAFEQLKLKNLKYDILYFSANLYGNDNKLIDKNLAHIVSAKAAHAYIVNHTIYDFILSAFANINWDDPANWNHSNPNRMNMDVWYKNIQSFGNVYGVYPSIAEQRSGFSDLIKMDCYYNLSSVYNKILEKSL